MAELRLEGAPPRARDPSGGPSAQPPPALSLVVNLHRECGARLAREQCEIDLVARDLGIVIAPLQRRLSQEGTSRQIVLGSSPAGSRREVDCGLDRWRRVPHPKDVAAAAQGPPLPSTPGVARTQHKRKKRSKLLRFSHLLAGSTGLEPAASGVTGRRSNQLNYDPKVVQLASARAAKCHDRPRR